MGKELDRAFSSACRILLKAETGGLAGYEGWLSRYSDRLSASPSSVSGENVFHSENFSKNARFVTIEEAAVKQQPIRLDDIKDIDSLVSAAGERMDYAGNKTFGKSRFVEGSDCIHDSVFVASSQNLSNCEYAAFCQMVDKGKYVFGCAWMAGGQFLLNCSEIAAVQRSLETFYSIDVADAYFSYNCKSCQELMFCFNQYGKRNCIGNNQLQREKYSALKGKLLAELGEMLLKEKKLPSLVELCGGFHG